MLARLAARLCDVAVRAAAYLEHEPAVAHPVGDCRVLAEGHEVEVGGISQVALRHRKEFAVHVPLILPENEERALELIPARATSAELVRHERTVAHLHAFAPSTGRPPRTLA